MTSEKAWKMPFICKFDIFDVHSTLKWVETGEWAYQIWRKKGVIVICFLSNRLDESSVRICMISSFRWMESHHHQHQWALTTNMLSSSNRKASHHHNILCALHFQRVLCRKWWFPSYFHFPKNSHFNKSFQGTFTKEKNRWKSKVANWG